MNLEESNEFIAFEKQKNKKKKIILVFIFLLIIAVILLILFLVWLKNQDAKTYKLYFNGNKANWSNSLFITKDNKTYISSKEIAKYIEGEYNKGEYKAYTQDKDHGYIQTQYEIISFKVGSKYIKKYLLNSYSDELEELEELEDEETQNVNNQDNLFIVDSQNDTLELFEISSEVILENDNIYVPLEDVERVFNIKYVEKDRNFYLYNLTYLYSSATRFVAQQGIPVISNTYENVRALSQNMAIVANNNNKFGVISTESGENILSYQYTKILYLQSTNEFFVYTADSVGLLNANGETIIAPTKYDSLTVFDEINKLYLAKKNDKYGLLNVDGEVVVPVSFKAIGVNAIAGYEDFEIADSETPNLINSKFIAVADESSLGLYDIKGKRVLRTSYDSFGYIASVTDKSVEIRSTLLIPKSVGINGMIVEQDGYYGICDLDAYEIVIPCSLSKIYCKSESGELDYYMELDDEVINIKNYLKNNDFEIDEVDESEEDFDNEDEIDDDEVLPEEDFEEDSEDIEESEDDSNENTIEEEYEDEETEEYEEDSYVEEYEEE